MRTIALDLHKRFAEVAVNEAGRTSRLGRIEISRRALESFACSLGPTDHIVLESSSMSFAVVELLSRHAGRVTISNPMKTKAIAEAKVKTDKIDARVLAELAAVDFIPTVWLPDAKTRALRLRLSHRASLVRERTRLRNQVHALLQRELVELSASDLFGRRGRRELAVLRLEADERSLLESTLRLHDALQAELEAVDRALAGQALASAQARRLMTIPGLGPITALALVALVGDVSRFPSARRLVGYVGLDPRVRQSGERPARLGHISRQGQAHARGLLIEAAHAAIKTPGPLRAFYRRVSSRRGAQIALVATARKLTTIAWHVLREQEDYRYQLESLSRRKLRRLQLAAGDDGPAVRLGWQTSREALERRLLEEAERSYCALVEGKAKGAGAATGEATPRGPLGPDDARQAQ